MKYCPLLVALAIAMLTLAGCGKPEETLFRTWVVDQAKTEAEIEKALRAEPKDKEKPASDEEIRQGVAFFGAIVRESQAKLVLREDMTFTLEFQGKVEDEGTWTLTKSTITFNVTTQQGVAKPETFIGTFANGAILVKPSSDQGVPIVFTPVR